MISSLKQHSDPYVMTSTNARVQQNAKLGAARTEALLLNSFWVLERSIDVDGADFLAQPRGTVETGLSSTRASSLDLAYVQSKFFEGSNQVKIARHYVEHEGNPYEDFFAVLHTLHDQGDDHYVFSAEEITATWRFNAEQTSYMFSLTAVSSFHMFRNRSHAIISKLILDGLGKAKFDKTTEAAKRFYRLYAPAHRFDIEPPSYRLRIIDDCRVVFIIRPSGLPILLDNRRDLFPNFGTFAWGYAGSGPQALVTSLLAYHTSRAYKLEDQAFQNVLHLISLLDGESEAELPGQLIDRLIGASESMANEAAV